MHPTLTYPDQSPVEGLGDLFFGVVGYFLEETGLDLLELLGLLLEAL